MLVIFKCAVERFSQAVTFEHRRNFNFGSVVPCANKKIGRFKRAGFTEISFYLVGEIGILVLKLLSRFH